MQDLSIALIQTCLFWEDRQANYDHLEARLATLPAHVRLAILPEMFPTGFSLHPDRMSEPAEGPTLYIMREWARKYDLSVVGSAMVEEDGAHYNRLFFVRPDETFDTYDKRHLFSMAGENNKLSPGRNKLILDYEGCRIAPMICYDLRFPVWIRNKEHYDISIFVANWPDERVAHWRTLLKARAIENQVYVLGVNRVGKDGNGVPHSGYSAIISPDGEIIQEAAREEVVLTHVLSEKSLTKIRRQKAFLKDIDEFHLHH